MKKCRKNTYKQALRQKENAITFLYSKKEIDANAYTNSEIGLSPNNSVTLYLPIHCRSRKNHLH